MFQEMEDNLIGLQVTFKGASDLQANYTGNSDPRVHLQVGGVYHVSGACVGSSTTTLELAGFSGKTFNSVCFSFDRAAVYG